MRHLGNLKGSDLVKVLNTLHAENTFADSEQVIMLRLSHYELRIHVDLYFQGDVCIHAQASEATYGLVELLHRRRLLDLAQLEELRQLSLAQPQRSLNELLLEKQWVSATDLAQIANTLFECVSYETLLWQETAYDLLAAKLPAREFNGTGLPVERLQTLPEFLRKAETHVPVLMLMRERLGNPKAVLGKLKQVERYQLSEEQYHVYRFINNRNSIRDLVQLSELNYFDTLAALFQLLSWGYVGLGQLDKTVLMRRADMAQARQIKRLRQTPEENQNMLDKLSQPLHQGKVEYLCQGRGSTLLQVLVSVMQTGYDDGCVIVKNPKQDLEAEFTLYQGSLVHATTTAFEVRLGEMLIRRGIIDAQHLEQAIIVQKQSPDSRLGEILVSYGLIDEGEIPALVNQQMEAVLYEVLAWPEVHFFFEPNALIPQYNIYHKIPLKAVFEIHDGRLNRTEPSEQRNLLEEADQNLPILLMIREKIPSLNVIPRIRLSMAGIMSESEAQEAIMRGVDGKSKLQEILLSAHQDYFSVYTALFQLVGMGALELDAIETPARNAARQPSLRRAGKLESIPLHKRASSLSHSARKEPEAEAAAILTPDLTPNLTPEQYEEDALMLLRQIPQSRYSEVRQILSSLVTS